MIRKLFTIILVVLMLVCFASWQYWLICLLCLVLMWKSKIRNIRFFANHKYLYGTVVGILLFSIWMTLPNYFDRGRTRLVYLNEEGVKRNPPLCVYVANVLFPEKEVMNFCLKTNALFPSALAHRIGIGGALLSDARNDFWSGKTDSYYNAYNRLSLTGSNPGSFTIAQTWNELTGDNLDAIYITRPADYDSNRTYPVLFFAHGLMGSWELYNGITNRLDNCIVVHIGTRTLSGLFNKGDIEKCFTRYLPYLESEGYHVDRNRLYLAGLSNGGTAAEVALNNYGKRFAGIAYISTYCSASRSRKTKVLLIGGGKDNASAGLPSAYRRLKRAGADVALYWDENENHYLLAYKAKDVMDFIGREFNLQ